MSWGICGSQETTSFRSEFSLSTIWLPETELSSKTSVLTRWAILPPRNYLLKKRAEYFSLLQLCGNFEIYHTIPFIGAQQIFYHRKLKITIELVLSFKMKIVLHVNQWFELRH